MGRISNGGGVEPLHVAGRHSSGRGSAGDSYVLSSHIGSDCNVLGDGFLGDGDELGDRDATVGKS